MRDVDSAMCALLLHAQCSALSRSQVKKSPLYTSWAAQLGHPPAPGGRLRGTKARVAAGNQAAMHGSLLTATGHGGARCCKMCCLALIVASTHSILRELMV